MFRPTANEWPAQDEQVIGIVLRDGGADEVAWWTRTSDGWYVSDTFGNLGHRDAFTKDDSQGPDLWTSAHKRWRQGVGNV